MKSESPTPTEISMEDDGHTSAHISLNEDLQSKSDKKSPGRSANYSDDFSGDFVSKVKNTARDHSESSDSQVTPEIVLKDNSLDVLGRKQVLTAVAADKEKSKDSFLSDLPPLGNVGKSSLSDLPPLPAVSGRTLAPLSKIPPKNIDSGLETKTESKKTSLGSKKKVESSVPTFGFDSDHVVSEKSQSSRNKAGKVKSPEPNSEVTENIEEELDSFLNSEVSDDITRDETIQEGESLKADYVASL